MEDNLSRLEKIVESVAKTAMINSDLIADTERQILSLQRENRKEREEMNKRIEKIEKRIEELREDTREIQIENQRILRYLESRG